MFSRSDYKNIEYLFGKLYGFTIEFDLNEQGKFRQQWRKYTIIKYIENIKNQLLNDENGYDGLIFALSADGDTDEDDKPCFLDSAGKEHRLDLIYSSFNEKNIPKLFLVECSRGPMPPKNMPAQKR